MSFRPWPRVRGTRVPAALGVLAALSLGGGPAGLAAGGSRIELRDGSVFSGELIGVESGRYRIRTALMGEIEVKESDVLAIRPAESGGSRPPALNSGPADYSGAFADIGHQVLSDPGLLGSIMELQNDPELQSALADPGFVGLIMSGNVDALKSDPRFLHLMAHPTVQAIIGRVTGH